MQATSGPLINYREERANARDEWEVLIRSKQERALQAKELAAGRTTTLQTNQPPGLDLVKMFLVKKFQASNQIGKVPETSHPTNPKSVSRKKLSRKKIPGFFVLARTSTLSSLCLSS